MTSSRTPGYSATSIIIHWIGAATVATLFLIGNQFEDMARGADKNALIALHISLGVFAVVLLGGRIAWRLFASDGGPEAGVPARRLDLLANLVKYALLLVMAVLIVTGPLSIWFEGHAIDVFGTVSLPSPFAVNRGLHRTLEQVHGVASKVVVVLVALHVLGALKHLVIDRDGVFRRMLVPARKG